MTFDNRTAVITGAAGRIGRATAAEFARHGVKLVLADINMEKLDPVVAKLQEITPDVRGIRMDVSDPENIQEGVEKITAEVGRVDILVNNAGAWPQGSALESSFEDWRKILNINLNSAFYLSNLFGKQMKKQKYGRIINLGSIAGESGLPERCAYSVAKAGIIMLTKTMAMELAKDNVTVNCVSPGMIDDHKAPNRGTWLGRSGTGEEVANAIVFFAADESSYITGTDLPVDGGRILGPLTTAFKHQE